MKLKILFLFATVWLSVSAFAQNVGIGTASPGTKLDVNGAVTYRETAVAISGNAATIPSNVSQVRLTGTATATIALTAPAAPPNAGEQLVIYNNTTGGYGASYGSTTIPDGVAISFIYSNSAWVASSDASSGSSSYIQNQTTQQASSNFNISGNGEIGTAAIIGTGEATASPTGGSLRGPNAGAGTNTPGGALNISGGYAYGSGLGGTVTIMGGTTSTGGTEGPVYIRGGYNSGIGQGNVSINDDHGGNTYINTAGGTTYEGGTLVIGTGDGTTTPVGSLLRAPNNSGGGAGGTLNLAGGNGYGTGGNGGSVIITAGANGSSGYNGNLYLRAGSSSVTNTAGNVYINDASNASGVYGGTLINPNGGTVTIGNQTGIPYLTGGVLSIASAGTNYQAPISAGAGLYYSAANTLASYWTVSGNNIYNNNNSGAGFVGIGTNGTPASILHVKTSGNTFATIDGGSGSQEGFNFYVNGSGRTNLYFDPNSTTYNSNGALLINNYGSSTPDVVIDLAGGAVGIGVAKPLSTLEVGGFNTTNSTIKTGALELQSFALNNSWYGENTYYNGGFKYRAAGYATLMYMNSGAIDFRTAPSGAAAATAAMTSRMIILNNGYVGIGTSTPACPLEVEATNNAGYGSATGTYTGGAPSTTHGYLYDGSSPAGYNSVAYPAGSLIAIYTSGRIFCSELDAISDRRVKKDFTLTDSKDDIERLSKIEVTNFRYKDEVANGSNVKKGFIAQQVETVYPEAVTRQSGFLPDIYTLSKSVYYDPATHSLTISIDADHGLAVGDKVRLIAGPARKDVTVSAVHPDCSFTVADWTSPVSQVFVYGKEVADFRAVDYDRIYTLNVSATQELARQLASEQARNKEMQQKIAEQEQKISTLDQKDKDARTDINKLKASVETLQQIIGAKAEK